MAFVNVFQVGGGSTSTAVRFSQGFRQLNEPFQAIMHYIARQEARFSSYVWHFDRVLEKLSYVAIAYPKGQKKLEYTFRIPLYADSGSFLSALVLGDHDKLSLNGFDFRFLEYGWSVHEWANEFTGLRKYVDDNYPPPYYTKRDRIAILESMVTKDAGFNKAIMMKIGAAPVSDTLDMPSSKLIRQTFFDKIKIIEDFVSNNPLLFGYSPTVKYGKLIKKSNTLLKRYWVPGDTKKKITLKEVELLSAERKIGDLLEAARENGQTLEIEVPVLITRKYEKGEIKQNNTIDFTFKNEVISVRDLEWFFTFQEDVLTLNPNDFATQRDPNWGVDQFPLIDKDVTFWNTLLGKQEVYKDILELYSVKSFSLIPRIS